MATILEVLLTFIYPLVAIVIAIIFGGLMSKYYPKTESWRWDAFQYGTVALVGIVVLELFFSFFQPAEGFQRTIAISTIFSLMFALLAIASGIIKDLNEHQKRVNLDADISDIQKDTQSILGRVALIEKSLGELKQQNQYQQAKNSVPEKAESHGGDGAGSISAN